MTDTYLYASSDASDDPAYSQALPECRQKLRCMYSIPGVATVEHTFNSILECGSFRPWVVSVGSFRPWVVSAHGEVFSTYVALDPTSSVIPIKYQEYQAFPNKNLKFCTPPPPPHLRQKISILYLALRK